MLINSVSKAVFTGNGIATQFPFAFKVWTQSQLLVQVTTPQGETLSVTDFTAVLTEDGGTVTYMYEGAPLAEGYTLVILRQMPFSQEVDLINGTRFDAHVIEDALDKATAERQQLKERMERAITVTPSSDITPDEFVDALVSSAEQSRQYAEAAAQSEANAAQSEAEAQVNAVRAENAAETVVTNVETALKQVEDEGEAQVQKVLQTATGIYKNGMVYMVSNGVLFGGSDGRRPIFKDQTEANEYFELCDGQNNTPDLRDRMIRGGDGTNTGAIGGSFTGKTGEHILTVDEMPAHTHGIGSTIAYFQSNGANGIGTSASNLQKSTSTGGSQGHSHTQDLPPYYTVAFVMYVGDGVQGIVDFVTQEILDEQLDRYARKEDIPRELPNPYELTINGKRYDGSTPVEVTITGGSGGGIEEAPADGKLYGRKNFGWYEVPEGGGNVYDDTEIKQEISDVQRQIVYARPSVKGMVRVSDGDNAIQIHLTGDDDTIPILDSFPLKGKPIKVLCIGNSFSDDMTQWIGELLKSTGYTDFSVCSASIGGSTLEVHVSNMGNTAKSYTYHDRNQTTPSPSSSSKSLLEAIQAQPWDVVTVQQVSGDSGVYDTITPYLQTLIDYIKTNCSNKDIKIVYHMAWAYASDSTHSKFPNYGSNQKTMYEAQSATAQKILADYPDIYALIPSNTVVQNARSIPTLEAIGNELTRDGYHIDYEEGRTLLGLGMIQNLLYPVYGVSVDAVQYASLPSTITSQLSKEEYDLMIPVVKQSFVYPFDSMDYYADVYDVQKKLVSGESIKTVNGQSLLGSGNIAISGGSGSEPSIVEDLGNANIAVSLTGNTVYKYGELASLNITAQDSSYVPSLVYFLSGATPTNVTYPEDAGYIPLLVTIEANTPYVIRNQGGYFEVLKRTPPASSIPEYTEYTDYTVIQGFCGDWTPTDGLSQYVSISGTEGEIITYKTSPNNVTSVTGPQPITATMVDYVTSKRPLSVPAGTKFVVLQDIKTRICVGTTMTNGTREDPAGSGARTYTVLEDSIVMINTQTLWTSYQSDSAYMRTWLDSRLKILVPTAKLAQVNNNEV